MSAREALLQDLSETWMAAVCRHDLEAVIKHYTPTGVLVGTIAQRIKHGHGEIRKYFTRFLAKDGLRGKFDGLSLVQRHLDWGIHTGTYTFKWYEEGRQVVVPARYTIVWTMTPEGWRITNHHSSALPE